MNAEFQQQPLIITGMHRSGTTLLTGLLRDLGFFGGSQLDKNQESKLFLQFDEWVLRRAGGAWDYPLPVKRVLAEEMYFKEAVLAARETVEGKRFKHFKGNSPLPSWWGWKDPRCVFLYPVWKELFPGAKWLFIHRNGVDVAASLRVRARQEQHAVTSRFFMPPKKHDLLPRTDRRWDVFYPLTARCLDLEGAFALWEAYNAELQCLQADAGEACLTVGYEKLLQDPKAELGRVLEWLAQAPGDAALEQACGTVKPDGAYRFTSDEELSSFYRQVKDHPLMKEFGYGAIGEQA